MSGLVMFLVAFVLGALLPADAVAQPKQVFIPLLVYRTGPYVSSGIPVANGRIDYYTLVNDRDGGINGVNLAWEECEFQYDTTKGVECYDRLKGKGAVLVSPVPSGLAAKGYLGAAFHASGTGFKVHQDIFKHVYDRGKGAGKREEVGQVLYNRGLAMAMYEVEAIRTAMTRYGNKPLTDFDLPTAIESALTLVRDRATQRGIALQKTLDERVGQVQADERKVRQVVLNLLSNAIKFTPEGGRIEAQVVPSDGSVEVSVRDTGVGIAPEDQEAVFEEFRQVGTADKKAECTGLGLALCRKFVELDAGTIWVTSAVGAGSTFTFRLPVRPWAAP